MKYSEKSLKKNENHTNMGEKNERKKKWNNSSGNDFRCVTGLRKPE
jgi:hypothetical protein